MINRVGSCGTGIRISSNTGTGHRIEGNSISSNGLLGIDLGNDDVTDNDPKDILGKLNSTPRKVFTIQFFSNPSATGAEGETFLGELNVRTGRKGTVSFKFITTKEVAAGEAVSATATAFSTNDTSASSPQQRPWSRLF